MLTGDTDDRACARLGKEEEVEESPPLPCQGQCVQTCAEANPPPPPGIVLESEGVEDKDFWSVVPFQTSAVRSIRSQDVSSGAYCGLTKAFPVMLQMRVAAQRWNDASSFGLCCELFCFLMRDEAGAPTTDWLLLGRLLHRRKVGHFSVPGQVSL